MKDYKFIYSEKNQDQSQGGNSSSQSGLKIIRDPKTGLWKTEGSEYVQEKEEASPTVQVSSAKKETIASLVARSAVKLAQAGVKNPREDAEILLAFCCSLNRTGLYKIWRENVDEKIAQKFDKLIQRRTKREPVGYIIGTVPFYGLEFMVDSRVMIPRPETELLVQKVIESAKGWKEVQEYLFFADVGTGSGVISITCGYNLNFLKVFAIDISEEVLEVTKINATKYHLENNITFLKGNLLEVLPQPVHIIVANLPYISNDEFKTLEPEITQYEPQEAFLAGADGLWHIKNLLSMAPEYLLRGGKIFLEIGASQGQAVKDLVKQNFPFSECEIIKDLAGLDRIVVVHTS